MPFSTVFHLYRGVPVHLSMLFYSCLTSTTPHNILFKPPAGSPITIVETMDSGEKGMDLVAMTIINPRKKY